MDWSSQGPALGIAAGVAIPLLGIIYALLRETIAEQKKTIEDLKKQIERSLDNNKDSVSVIDRMSERLDEVLTELKDERRRREARA